MEYRLIKEFYNKDLSELQMNGINNADMVNLNSFLSKYNNMLKMYKKLHPFRYLLIRIFPFLGDRW